MAPGFIFIVVLILQSLVLAEESIKIQALHHCLWVRVWHTDLQLRESAAMAGLHFYPNWQVRL